MKQGIENNKSKDLDPCACCGYKTRTPSEPYSYEICPICFWEVDFTQENNSDLAGGANRVNIKQAQANFLNFGACEKNMLPHVRKPFEWEKP